MSLSGQAFEAQALYQESLLSKQNVVGVAVGYKEAKGNHNGDLAVVVLVEQKKPLAALSAHDLVPPELEGIRTDVYEIGYLRAFQTPRDRFRPLIPNGVSLGHYKVTAGTLGTIVRDATTGERLILSNNHVLANCNDAFVGDAILQPATMDNGKQPDDVVARLERFIPLRYIDDPLDAPPLPQRPMPNETPMGCSAVSMLINLANFVARVSGSGERVTVMAANADEPNFASQTATRSAAPVGSFPASTSVPAAQPVPENLVDCAVAKPIDDNMFSDDILNIGIVNETKPPALGMRVRKSGRTTGYTEGNITLLNATVNVGYSTAKGPRTARLVGQVISESISQGGDSGSLVVDAIEDKAVGLLFAGSSLATIFTPIDVVLNALNIRL